MERQENAIQIAMAEGWLSLDEAAEAYTKRLVGLDHAKCFGREPRCSDYNCQNNSLALNYIREHFLDLEQRTAISGLFALHRPNWRSVFNAQYAFVDREGKIAVCTDYTNAHHWLNIAPDLIAISNATNHSSKSQLSRSL
jgi:hypothetical protein